MDLSSSWSRYPPFWGDNRVCIIIKFNVRIFQIDKIYYTVLDFIYFRIWDVLCHLLLVRSKKRIKGSLCLIGFSTITLMQKAKVFNSKTYTSSFSLVCLSLVHFTGIGHRLFSKCLFSLWSCVNALLFPIRILAFDLYWGTRWQLPVGISKRTCWPRFKLDGSHKSL